LSKKFAPLSYWASVLAYKILRRKYEKLTFREAFAPLNYWGSARDAQTSIV
jgi:hypothetical protein